MFEACNAEKAEDKLREARAKIEELNKLLADLRELGVEPEITKRCSGRKDYMVVCSMYM